MNHGVDLGIEVFAGWTVSGSRAEYCSLCRHARLKCPASRRPSIQYLGIWASRVRFSGGGLETGILRSGTSWILGKVSGF